MGEIREAALAYYRASTQDLQNLAYQFFQSMDANGDGKISLQEFQQFTAERGWQGLDYMFQKFDLDGDGNLDFYEVLTLYYAIKSGRLYSVSNYYPYHQGAAVNYHYPNYPQSPLPQQIPTYCSGNGCGVLLTTLFFTCVQCRDHGNGRTFDLCSRCYGDRRFNHEHSFIIDNYLLLEHKRLLSQQVSNSRSLSNYYHHHQGAAFNYPSPYYTPIPSPQQIPTTSYPYQPQLHLQRPPPPPPGFIYTLEPPTGLQLVPIGATIPNSPTGWQVVPIEETSPNRVTWHKAFQAFEAALGIGSFAVFASTVCSIM